MRSKQDKRSSKRNPGTPVIRREEASSHASHSGAWKIAYADFVTAMMAFFLLMWLMNATTEDQRKGLADYFSPTNLLSHNSSGAGQPFGGRTAFEKGALVSDRGAVQITQGQRPVLDNLEDQDSEVPGRPGQAPPQPVAPAVRSVAIAVQPPQTEPIAPTATDPLRPVGQPEPAQSTPSAAKDTPAADAAKETRQLEAAAQQLKDAVQSDPALAGLAQHLAIDITPAGLRIQLLDTQNQPMFAFGSAAPNEAARMLLTKIAPVLLRLPEQVSIAGHTDAAPYPGTVMTNWELSSNRANAARRMLIGAGLPEQRLREVTGHADHDLLLPADPLAAANRRIAILVLRGTAPAATAEATDQGEQASGP